MARRNRTESASSTPESTEESTVSTATEAVEATESTEPTETATEATEAPATEAAAPATEVPIDLTAFKAAVASAIEGHDNDAGTVPDELVAPVTEQYRALDGVKPKNAAKKFVEEQMREGMASMNIGLARAYMVLSDNLTAGATAKADRQPADPTEALVQRVAGITLARELITVPEGVQDGWEAKVTEALETARDQATAYQTFLATEVKEGEEAPAEPEVPGWVKAAVKLAQGKSAKVGGSSGSGPRAEYTGERRDIGKHIAEAFEGQETGKFLTIAEIRSFKSNEYGDNPPSAGAISARLFPKTGKMTLDFVKPDTNEKGNKGATKL